MLAIIIFLTGLGVAAGVSALAAWSDARYMQIPNPHSLIILAAFFISYAGLWVLGVAGVVFAPFVSHLLSGLIVFGVSAALFGFGMMGAGDSKLASALALWTGFSGLYSFLIVTVLAGGVLALMALAIGKFRPFAAPPEGSWPDQVQQGKSKVPYGIGIFIGALASFAQIGYFNMNIYAVLATSG